MTSPSPSPQFTIAPTQSPNGNNGNGDMNGTETEGPLEDLLPMETNPLEVNPAASPNGMTTP